MKRSFRVEVSEVKKVFCVRVPLVFECGGGRGGYLLFESVVEKGRTISFWSVILGENSTFRVAVW